MNAYAYAERLLTVENLNLSYQGKQILRDINLHVNNVTRPGIQQGQVVALLGPSGCGKTQLLRQIAGLQAPDSGAVMLNGTKKAVTAGEVGLVFQNYPLLEHRTIRSNLELAARKLAGKEVLETYVKQFGLVDKLDLYPAQLSGGQKQRVAIIQQLLCSTHFVLLDEPTSGLDIVMQKAVCKLLTELSQVHEHNTFIITTHNISTAVMLADTVWVLGFEKQGNQLLPGATVIKQLNLIERGLAWNSDVANHPSFGPTIREIEALFS